MTIQQMSESLQSKSEEYTNKLQNDESSWSLAYFFEKRNDYREFYLLQIMRIFVF